LRLYGLTPDEYDGNLENIFGIFHPDDREKVQQGIQEMLAAKKPRLFEYRVINPQGGYRIIEGTNQMYFDEDGNIVQLIGHIQDITKQKEAELELQAHRDRLAELVEERTAELLESEARYRTVVEDQTEFISRWKPDGTLVFVNDRYCELFNIPRGELIGNNVFNIISDKAGEKVKHNISKFTPEQPTYTSYEYQSASEERKNRWYQWTRRGIFDQDGKLVAVQNVGRDITERKKAEDALQKSESRYRAIVEDQTEFIVRHLPDTTRTFVSQSYCRHLGRSYDDLIGTRILDELSEQDQDRFKQKLSELTIDNPTRTDEYREITPDDTVHWERWMDRAIFDDGGNVIEYQSVGRDITKRKLAEQTLREREAQIRTMVENIPDGVIGIDHAGLINSFNPAAEVIFGYEVEEVIGETITSIMPEKFREAHSKALQRFIDKNEAKVIGKGPVELEGLRRDGSIFPISIAIGEYQIGKQSFFTGIIRDITERKRAEQDLHKRTQELETFNKIMVDREIRIIEMKEEVNALCEELGHEPAYPPLWRDSAEDQ